MNANPVSSPSFSTHRERKYNAVAHRILEAARAIMREQGVAALSMQEIARRMDLRAPSLYHYYASKMEIYDHLFRYGYSLYETRLEEYLQGIESWQEYARKSFECYLDFANQNPELYQLCFERPVPGFVPSEESLKVSFGLLQRSYRRAEKFKKTMHTNLSTQRMVDLLIAVMHGITAMHISNEPELPPGQGRFGALIPAALEVLEKAWSQP
jgi:AcrR family transcriptional regulator